MKHLILELFLDVCAFTLILTSLLTILVVWILINGTLP